MVITVWNGVSIRWTNGLIININLHQVNQLQSSESATSSESV